MQLRLLGSLELVDADRPVALGSAEARTVLAVLALNAGTVVPKDRLVEALWGDHPPRGADEALHDHVLALGETLSRGRSEDDGHGDLVIEARDQGYVLEAGPDALDTAFLARLVSSARRSAAAGDRAASASLLTEALGLWRGPSLGELADHPLARPEAARLEALRQELAQERLACQLALERSAVARHPSLDPAPTDGPPPFTELVTFLFTDIEGSTERWEQRPAAMRTALQRHDALLQAAVARHGGEVFKAVGDALHAVFSSAAAGVRAALEAQRDLLAEEWGEMGPLGVRMALYTGEAEPVEGDWLGRPLNRCARLLAAAHGGQVLVSEATAALLGDDLPPTAALVDLGVHRLRGIARPERVLQLVGDGLPSDFPSLVSLEPPRPQRPMPPALAPRPDAVFVGRRREVERLASAWRQAKAGQRQVVFVAGEPGIGKTSLAHHVAAQAHGEGAIVLHGHCDEGPGLPYQPFSEALQGYVAACASGDLRAQLGPLGPELVRLVPTLPFRLPDLAEPMRAEPETERYRLFEAVGGFLATLSTAAPVLLVLEDLHWAAKPALLMLCHLLRSTHQPRLLVMGTYRDTEVGPTHPLREILVDLRRGSGVGRLTLTGLDRTEGLALVAASVGEELSPRSVDAAGALHAHTGGNPFFLLETLRYLGDVGAISADGEVIADPEALGVPEGAREVICRRLSRLSPAANRALGVASVVGDTFTLGLMRRIPEAADDVDTLLDALDEAVAARVVVESSERPGDYSFTHALVRQVVYGELGSARRGHLHHRVGDVLEALPGVEQGHLGALAHHFAEGARAGTVDKAARYALQAGRKATGQLAFEEAVSCLERGIQVLELDYPPDPSRRSELLLALADARKRSGDVAGSKEAARQAAEDAAFLGSAEGLARAAVLYASFGVAGHQDPLAVRLCEQALRLLGPEQPALRARVLASLAVHEAFWEGRGMASGERAQEALDLARRLDDTETLEAALFARALSLAGSEQVAERLALAEELVALALEADDVRMQARGLRVRALARLELGDLAGFDADLARLEQLGTDLRYWVYRSDAAQWRTLRALLEGRLDHVEALVDEMLAHSGSDPNYLNASVGQLFFLRRDQGRLHEVRSFVAGAAEDNPGLGVFQAVLAVVHAETGDLEEARRQLERAAADRFDALARDFTRTASMALMAEVAAAVGDAGSAATLYQLLRPRAGHLVVVGWGVVCAGPVDRYLGMLAATLGRWTEAEAHYEAALATEARMGSPTSSARTRTAYARMLLARDGAGDRARAAELLDAALATADAVGMAGLAAAVRSLATV